jgi:hypothetical protein
MNTPEDPPRWSDGTGTKAALSTLLSSAKHDGGSDAELSELRARLGTVLNEPPASSSPALPPLAKLAAGALITALGAFAILYLQHRNAPPRTDHDLAPAPLSNDAHSRPLESAAAPPAPVLAAPSAESPAPPPVASTKKHSTGQSASSANGIATAQSEATVLEEARRTLTTNPAQSLALTQRHAAQFPHGLLSQEREVIAISALRRLGRTTEAEARAARFDALYPKSAHQHAVDSPAAQ